MNSSMRANETSCLKAEGFMNVRHLTLHGTNFEIGRRLAEIAIQRYGKSPANYMASPLYASAARLLPRNYPILWERARGVAAAFGLDPNVK